MNYNSELDLLSIASGMQRSVAAWDKGAVMS